jgi:tetratricopeptide (TPR) repeat protein
MASAYRGLGKYEQALNSLDKAGNLFAKHEYPRQYGVIALETACCYENLTNFTEAIQWAQIALNELQTQEMTYHIGIAHHCLGVCYAYTDNTKLALENIEKALDIWDLLGNEARKIMTGHLLAYVEAKKGQSNAALERLQLSLQKLEHYPDNNWRSYWRDKIRRLTQAIENGEDLSQLSPDN